METLTTLRPIDIRVLDEVFDMGGGYVLDFSSKRAFAEFFQDELQIDIYDPWYGQAGGSMGKRLRFFLRHADGALALKAIIALWEYRQVAYSKQPALPKETEDAFWKIVERLGGKRPGPPRTAPIDRPTFDPARIAGLKEKHISVSELDPVPRGFAFEKFLQELFDAYGLGARASFRLRGEQIDGSFLLASEVYLLEAKWENPKTGAAALHAFNGKVTEKSHFSRGLFLSNSGFTEDGLEAFGRGKRVVCMDGFDLHEVLDQRLDLAEVMALKVRRLAETGKPFVRVRDLWIKP